MSQTGAVPNRVSLAENPKSESVGAEKIPLPKPFANANQWVTAFLVLGIVLRVSHYFVRFPLNGDEARLAANFVGATYGQLTHTLRFNQVAPIPFLWGELFLTKLLGFSEYSLRLIAFIASVASLALFVHLAKRTLSGPAMVLAVAVFSVSGIFIRYSAEAKPYSLDLLVALILITLVVEWWRTPVRVAWLWGLALFSPVASLLSFPSVFATGAIGATFAWPVWQSGDRRARWALAAFGGLLIGTFWVLLRIVVGSQYEGVHHDMVEHWQEAFPPVSHPWRLPLWFLRTFSGPIMAYPWGGNPPSCVLTFALFAVGLYALWRTKHRWLVTLTLAMIVLGMSAAALHRYPFGRAARLVQYLAPSICLALGVGVAQVIMWLRRPLWKERALRWTICLLFCVAGPATLIVELVKPHKGVGTEIHRGFARWFWMEDPKLQNVCVDLDMHLQLYDPPPPQTYLEPAYPCYRAIYDRQRASAADSPEVVRFTTAKGLRCVLIHMEGAQRKEVEFEAWMSQMKRWYELTGHCSYRLPLLSNETVEHENTEIGVYEVYAFRPRHLPRAPSLR